MAIIKFEVVSHCLIRLHAGDGVGLYLEITIKNFITNCNLHEPKAV